MTAVELAEMMAGFAADGDVTPLKAFTNCTKAGMVSVKREQFETEFEKLRSSALLRKLSVRSAREGEFTNSLAEACLAADPPEEHVTELVQALQHARQNPRAVGECLEMFEPYMDAASLTGLREAWLRLWPQFAPSGAEEK